MRALHILGKGKVEIAEFPTPVPKENEVLIKVTASGVCGSEMHGLRAEQPQAMNGGHEVAGVVADPNGHAQWEAGDEVVVFTLQGCGKCRWCRAGQDTFCTQVGAPAATHAQYITSKANGMVKKPTDLSWPLTVMLGGDGLGVPYGASTRAGVKRGDITVVFGCGPVGLGMVLVQAFLGAHVIAVEPSEARRKLAMKMGAWATLAPAPVPEMVATLKGMTDGVGPDKMFEAVGRQETLDIAIEATRPEGVIMCAGHGKQSIDPQKLIVKRNLTMMGNWVSHPGWFPGMLQMWREGLDVPRLITGIYPYEQAQTAYTEMLEGRSGKTILTWE
ncbi:MAG: hypothetical protein A3K19_29550 [Lentisphaerae bacterium RIFOXYB12_FULL_65_16]|nr:MAG: hypothetical protein A3K18_03850 [Lentisphaerae bacterium RIFOXYA12_64_32]OGV92992.1 MAG: hypothetical protein A3K19_29550 [Lentisphaerae bacterium RIFOXYB12_FULL_65_16]